MATPERDDRTEDRIISMGELLAACAAASAVSTPPGRERADEEPEDGRELRDEAA
ncbi:hypothetical protein [Streptomyces termitum]|uniref:hypothetical protein n=1 Tax=Streptomyces termitum TaxID=67368 RepID=UPI00339F4E32